MQEALLLYVTNRKSKRSFFSSLVTVFHFNNAHVSIQRHMLRREVLPRKWTSGWTAAWRPAAGCAGAATARSYAPSPPWGAATWWSEWCDPRSRRDPTGRRDAPICGRRNGKQWFLVSLHCKTCNVQILLFQIEQNPYFPHFLFHQGHWESIELIK